MIRSSSSGHRRTVSVNLRRAIGITSTVVVAALSTPHRAYAAAPSFGPNDVQTLFFISKSEGKNRVDYGMHLDDQCAAAKRDAVFPYWRELEKSPVRTDSLALFERAAYGVDAQNSQKRSDAGSEAVVRLKHVDRTIYITTTKDGNGRCSALVRTQIGKVPYAELDSIHVKLSGPVSVDYIDVKGKDLTTGKAVEERIVP